MQEESARRWVLAFAQLSLPPRISLSVSTLCRVSALRVLFSFHSSGPFIFRPRCKSSRSFSSVALSCQPHRMAVTAERASAARLPSCGTRVCQLSFFSQKKSFSQKALHVSSTDTPALESKSHAHHGFVLQEEFCLLEENWK